MKMPFFKKQINTKERQEMKRKSLLELDKNRRTKVTILLLAQRVKMSNSGYTIPNPTDDLIKEFFLHPENVAVTETWITKDEIPNRIELSDFIEEMKDCLHTARTNIMRIEFGKLTDYGEDALENLLDQLSPEPVPHVKNALLKTSHLILFLLATVVTSVITTVVTVKVTEYLTPSAMVQHP
jgi:hypothetical protein